MGLSDGQKQRVASARAILANPRILIIAHRLSTLKDAQKIMVIDQPCGI